jgi:alpha-L-fucosidase
MPDGTTVPNITYDATWASTDQHAPAPEWFRDAKFGIYFHWGVYSVPAYSFEWYPRLMNTPGSKENQHHISTFGDPSVWPYHFFILGAKDKAGNFQQFAPKLKSAGGKFDPDEWAQLFADAGARFAGPVAEHHDGFSMWGSTVNQWNAKTQAPKLDLVGLLSRSIRCKGLRLLIAMHHAYNITGYYPTTDPTYAPAKSIADKDTALEMLYGKLPTDQSTQVWVTKLKEVIDGYQPDILWQDFNLRAIAEQARLDFLAYYFNKEKAWGRQVIATYKDGFDQKGEMLDYERGGAADLTSYVWLTDDSISPSSWSYTTGMRYYTATAILHSLLDRISKNGQLLLDIAPMADGTIPQEQRTILLSIGDWLHKFGESVYATRPWVVYGEGPTKMGGGTSFQAPKEGTATDIRFSRNKANNALYAVVLGWPGNGAQLRITTLASSRINLGTLTKVSLLGETSGNEIVLPTHTQTAQGLDITMPATAYQAMAYAIKLEFSGQIPALN